MKKLKGFGKKAEEYQKLRAEVKRLRRENKWLRQCITTLRGHDHVDEFGELLHEDICLPLWAGEEPVL